MTDQVILESLEKILRELLFDNSLELSMQTVRSDIPNWDSFAYVNFIVAVEMQHSIKFTVAEVESFENVGEIVSRTAQLTNQ